MSEDDKVMQAVQALERENGKVDASAVDPAVLCAWYRAVKPLLEKLLPVIAAVPKWGKAVADALRRLMKIADLLCPA